jgi:integrase
VKFDDGHQRASGHVKIDDVLTTAQPDRGNPMAVQKCQKNGRTMWRSRVKVDGRLVTAYRESKREAEEAEKRATAPKPVRKEAITLDDLWDRVLAFQKSPAARKPWRPSSVRVHLQGWARISPYLGSVKTDQIDQAKVDAFASVLTGARNTTANTLALLRLVLRRAAKWGLVERVPEISSVQEAAQITDAEWFTQAELASVLEVMTPQWRRLALVAARTGLRVGELQALRWMDVEPGCIHVRRTFHHPDTFGPPKNGKPRRVPLPSDAAEALRVRGHRDAFVFGGLARDKPEGPFIAVTYGVQIANAAKECGLKKHGNPHSMRHTWASHAVLEGVPSRVLMRWAGWSSERMVDRYAHLRDDDGDHYAERLAGVTTGVTRPQFTVVRGAKGA